ncbi:hypothetical protein GW756_03125 [bacterium]|nr:hypothetical protein [bacterium]NCQ55489.1 hypothetical protein [Candidatus Parcubacteria bacterium]NCS67499.1 hypothetical protein [Candidatus Peregrinibacteria bacterium]NCS96335.1 hypothetical protein [bacterium]
MPFKPGQVVDINADAEVIYYDGFDKKAIDFELIHLFIGEQFQEMKDLVGHSIAVYKDRTGRINEIEVVD